MLRGILQGPLPCSTVPTGSGAERWSNPADEQRARVLCSSAPRGAKKPMQMTEIPFGITDWAKVKRERHKGETGGADWKVCQFGDIRVRLLEYSRDYKAITGAGRGIFY